MKFSQLSGISIQQASVDLYSEVTATYIQIEIVYMTSPSSVIIGSENKYISVVKII